MDCLVLEVLDYRLDVLKILNDAIILMARSLKKMPSGGVSKWKVLKKSLGNQQRSVLSLSLSCVLGVSLSAQPSLLPMFDDMFNEAIHQLVQWGGIFVDEISEYVPFYLYIIISNMNGISVAFAFWNMELLR